MPRDISLSDSPCKFSQSRDAVAHYFLVCKFLPHGDVFLPHNWPIYSSFIAVLVKWHLSNDVFLAKNWPIYTWFIVVLAKGQFSKDVFLPQNWPIYTWFIVVLVRTTVSCPYNCQLAVVNWLTSLQWCFSSPELTYLYLIHCSSRKNNCQL